MAERRPQALCIGDLTASLPIIQGGMGVGVSLAGLAAAVANAGGIGVIATRRHRDDRAGPVPAF